MGRLIIICGTSFSGKTTLGEAIARRFGYAVVDVDETKDRLYGPGLADDQLAREDWLRIYDEADRQIEGHLVRGQTVIDASRNFRRAERRQAARIAAGAGVGLITIFVDTPEAVTRLRLQENRRTKVRVDIADRDFEHILQVWEPPGAEERPLAFRYGDDMGEWIAAHFSEPAGACGEAFDVPRPSQD